MRALILALCLSATTAFAQSLPVKLHDGDTWTFTAKHERLSDGARSQDYTVTTTKTLTWRAASDGAGELLMEHVGIVADPGTAPEAAAAQTLTIPIKFTVDATLAPNGVVNVDEVRAATRKLLADTGVTEDDFQQMTKSSPGILDQTAMALISRELGLLGRIQGTNLKKDLPNYEEDEVPNPIGGPPLRSRITYELLDYDADYGRAVINWKAEVDPQSLRDSLAELVNSVAEDQRAQAQAQLAKMKLEIVRMCRGDIDITSGLATKLICRNRTAVTEGGEVRQTFDRWEITQTLPGKPQ